MSRVIIASYDDELRAVLKYGLESQAYGIHTAYNINEAINLFRDDDLNVLIYDLDNGGFPKQTIEDYCLSHHLLVILTGKDTGMAFNFFSNNIGEFIIKPDSYEDMFAYEYFEALGERIKRYFSENKVGIKSSSDVSVGNNPKMPKSAMNNFNSTKLSADLEQEKVIVMGAASGGSEAIMEILMALPKDMPPIVIVSNFPRNMVQYFIKKMNNFSELYIKLCENAEYLVPGTVYIAPEDVHTKIERYGKRLIVKCEPGRKVNGVIPSIDVLFNSASEVVKEKTIGVLLTGSGIDGAKGLRGIKSKGGKTICQNEDSCVAKEKVAKARSLNASDMFIPLGDIAVTLQSIAK